MVVFLSMLTSVLSAFSERQLENTQRHLSLREVDINWMDGWIECYFRTVMNTNNVWRSNLGKETERKMIIEESSSLKGLLSSPAQISQ